MMALRLRWVIRLATVLSLLAVPYGLVALASCSSSTPRVSPSSPGQVLRESADRMGEIEFVAFTLEHEEGSASLGELGMELKRVEGKVALPDRFQLEVEAFPTGRTAFVRIGVIVIGGQSYMRFLGRWGAVDLGDLPFDFTDVGHTLGEIMLSMQAPTFPGDAEGAGELVHVRGTIASETLKPLVPNVQSGHDIGLEVWIAPDDHLLHRARVEGKLFVDDIPQVVRLLTLRDFDVPVKIESPVP